MAGRGRGGGKGGKGKAAVGKATKGKGKKGEGKKAEKAAKPPSADTMDDDMDAFMGRDVKQMKQEQLLAQLDADMDTYASHGKDDVAMDADAATAADASIAEATAMAEL